MMRRMFMSKIRRATVTQADLNYVGSITIDEELLDAAGIMENEQVHVLDIDNGNRLITYAIRGQRGSGVIGINGAAAHLVKPGDKVIILTYVNMYPHEAAQHRPTVVHVDENNKQITGETESHVNDIDMASAHVLTGLLAQRILESVRAEDGIRLPALARKVAENLSSDEAEQSRTARESKAVILLLIDHGVLTVGDDYLLRPAKGGEK